MITGITVRMFRAALNESRDEFSKNSGISPLTIKAMEDETSNPSRITLDKLVRYAQRRGFVFKEDGSVTKDTSQLIILEGKDAMSDFLDDVYNTALKHGTPENPCQVFLSNVVHSNWTKSMGKERWANHVERMIRDQEVMDVRILVMEGDTNFPAQSYSRYKWVPKDRFRTKSFYSYHDRLAFLDFQANTTKIAIIKQADFAEGYRHHFLDTWDFAAKEPDID